MARYHDGRTVQWGNWGIDFMDPQPSLAANYGVLVGRIQFPVGSRGPFEGDKGKWTAMCAAWVADRSVPAGFVPA